MNPFVIVNPFLSLQPIHFYRKEEHAASTSGNPRGRGRRRSVLDDLAEKIRPCRGVPSKIEKVLYERYSPYEYLLTNYGILPESTTIGSLSVTCRYILYISHTETQCQNEAERRHADKMSGLPEIAEAEADSQQRGFENCE